MSQLLYHNVSGIGERIGGILKKYNIRTAFKTTNTLGSCLTMSHVRIKQGVQFSCGDCYNKVKLVDILKQG